MRKILLTTTALVALGGVSAASAIDVSGVYEFTYNDTSNTGTGGTADETNVSGTEMGSDAQIDFSGSTTTDAGLTFGGMVRIATDQTNDNTDTQTVAVEDQGLYISGDFGYVMMGATDGVVDGMDNFMTSGSIVENGPATTTDANVNNSSNVLDNEAVGKIGYRSNDISGFQFGISYEDAGDCLLEWYKVGPEERERCGEIGRQWVKSDDSRMTAKHLSESFIKNIEARFENWKPREQYTLEAI